MVDKATNLVMNYTETEAKVREATNDDPWGPSGAQMQEVAAFTFTYEQVRSLFGYFFIFFSVNQVLHYTTTHCSGGI